MRNKTWMALLLSGALVVGATACGGGDDESSSDEATEDEAATQDDSSSDEGSSDEGSSDDASSDIEDLSDAIDEMPDMGNLDDCLGLSMAYAGLAMTPLGAMSGELSEADMEEFQAEIDELAGEMPEDVQDDFQVVADGYADYFAALDGVDLSDPDSLFDPDTADKLEEAGAVLETDEFTEANDNITAYFDELCGG